jgi:hypothetical protein
MNDYDSELYVQLTSIDGSECVHSLVWINSPNPRGFCFKPDHVSIPAKMVMVTHFNGRLENIRHIANEDLKEELLHWEDKWDWVHMRPIFSYTRGEDRAYEIIHEDDPSDDEEEEDENPTSVQQV